MTETLAAPEVLTKAVSPPLRFVFCEHTVQNVPEIRRHLDDVDGIALESVGGFEEERQELADIINGISISRSDTADAQFYQEQLEHIMDPAGDFTGTLALSLAASGKRIFLVDMGEDEPMYPSLQLQEVKAEHAFLDTLDCGSLDDMREGLDVMLDAEAATILAREELVGQQLAVILAHNPSMRLGVVAGSVHTPISYVPLGVHASERVFVDAGFSQAMQRRHAFAPVETALRSKRLLPDKPLGEELLTRALVQIITYQYDKNQAASAAIQTPEHALEEAVMAAITGLKKYLWHKSLEGQNATEPAGEKIA